jgi:hypothetical protein
MFQLIGGIRPENAARGNSFAHIVQIHLKEKLGMMAL